MKKVFFAIAIAATFVACKKEEVKVDSSSVKVGIVARVVAKPGKEKDVENFLKSALPLAEEENGTIHWFAFKVNDSTFGIFDTFKSDEGRQAHLNGKIAAALMANAADLLSQPPVIEGVDLLAVKKP